MRYSREFGEVIAKAYASAGSVERACEMTGLGKSTFYRWRSRYPEFDEAIRAAENSLGMPPEEFEELRNKAKAVLLAYLENGVTETTKTTDTKRDRDGEVVSVVTRESTSHKPCPAWVVERFLPARKGELACLEELIGYGLMPPEFAEIIGGSLDDLYERLRAMAGTAEIKERVKNGHN